MKIRFLKFSYFVWVLILLAIWLVIITLGTPHLRWSYSWRDEGQGYDPHAVRYYTRCTYVGYRNSFTVYPANGQCAFIRFQKKGGGQG